MSFGAFPKAVGHTAVGVSWRLVVFLAIALCFNTLIQLREWYTSYAPSEAWAKAAGKEAWSPEVSKAATAMSHVQSPEEYPSNDKFYKAILGFIKNENNSELADLPDVNNYRANLKRRRTMEDDFQQGIEPRDEEFLQKSRALSENTKKIADIAGTINHLEEIKKRDAIQEKVLKEAEEDLKQLRTKTLGLLMEVQELVTGRGTIEIGFQKKLAVLTSRIKDEEEGIREAFDAASLPARPVHHLSPQLQPLALQIGDEANPMHVFYLIAWYGLEAVIVLLLCGILVPWLLRFAGDTSDPDAVQSKVTQWIKNLLGKAFTDRAVAALAMAVVGSAAAAGVALAAGDQPSIIPPIWHDGATVAGAKGDQGEPGQSGGPGAPGAPGTPGAPGEDEKCDQCPEANLTDLRRQLEKQALLIGELEKQLADVTKKADKNIQDVLELDQRARTAAENMNRLSSGMTSITQDIDLLSGSVGGLYSAHQSILQISNTTHQQVLGSLYRLENGTLSTTSQVQSVRKTVDQAAKDVPPVASDVLWMNAVPDSAWARVSPFNHYKVTPQVRETLDRAMRGVSPDQKEMILAALIKIEGDKMGVRSFKKELLEACASEARLTLQQWTPLIVKLSRVQEQRHGE